ncbi:hypothetical protein ACFVIM_25205 [Streptomyces sp. NPDC057638]|uniref:hypothetical protein n=1 Tax=Streptomyces sp. NPDC057638 TaxID=3346190 RepID=UPI0036A42DA3
MSGGSGIPRRNVRWPALAATLTAGVVVIGGLLTAPGESATGPATERPAAAEAVGQGWHSVPVPLARGDLTAVAALDARRAWAVGHRLTGNSTAEAVALRWDGTAWRQESTLPERSWPQTLAVRADGDLWAAGGPGAAHHWNGTAWTTHQLAAQPGGRVVPDALATAPDGTVWLAGRALAGAVKDGRPAVQSWDGTAWRHHALPDTGRGELTAVTAVAPDDVWAVGATWAGRGSGQSALLFHYDGRAWTRVAAPPAAPGEHRWLSAVGGAGHGELWAVGGALTTGGVERPYAARWDGTRWRTAPTPPVADGRLRSVVRAGDGTVWAAGGKGAVSVLLRWDARLRQWSRAQDAGVTVRGLSAVPGTASLWTVGISRTTDLTPATALRP